MKLFFLILTLCFMHKTVLSQNEAYISTQKAVADIDYMMKMIEEVHYNPYFMVSQEQFKQNKEALINGFDQDSIPLKQFVATGMKLAAQMSGGHTGMDWQNSAIIPELKTYQFVPFTGELVEETQQFIVTRSAIPEIKEGTIIESINGISMPELYQECLSYIGGIASYKNSSCEEKLPLYLFFERKLSAPYSIKLPTSDKEIETAGIDISGLMMFINQAAVKENYTFRIVEDSIGLISYNSCTDYKVFRKFLKETFKVIKKEKIGRLIIDIRENAGGNSGLNDLLLSYITKKAYQQSSGRYWKVSAEAKLAYKENAYEKDFGKKFMQQYYKSENQSIIESFDEGLTQPKSPPNYFRGKTCFLIGPNTFSSANFLADAVKVYQLSTLIGAATGEYTNDFGEQLTFMLPNSGNYISVSSTYDIGANGNPTLFEPVYPDIKVEDKVLEFAVDWIRKKAD